MLLFSTVTRPDCGRGGLFSLFSNCDKDCQRFPRVQTKHGGSEILKSFLGLEWKDHLRHLQYPSRNRGPPYTVLTLEGTPLWLLCVHRKAPLRLLVPQGGPRDLASLLGTPPAVLQPPDTPAPQGLPLRWPQA